jgi:hypothetical protein
MQTEREGDDPGAVLEDRHARQARDLLARFARSQPAVGQLVSRQQGWNHDDDREQHRDRQPPVAKLSLNSSRSHWPKCHRGQQQAKVCQNIQKARTVSGEFSDSADAPPNRLRSMPCRIRRTTRRTGAQSQSSSTGRRPVAARGETDEEMLMMKANLRPADRRWPKTNAPRSRRGNRHQTKYETPALLGGRVGKKVAGKRWRLRIRTEKT